MLIVDLGCFTLQHLSQMFLFANIRQQNDNDDVDDDAKIQTIKPLSFTTFFFSSLVFFFGVNHMPQVFSIIRFN